MAKKLIGKAIDQEEQSFGLADALKYIELELERHAERYFDINLRELPSLDTGLLDQVAPESLELARKVQLRDVSKDALKDLLRDLRTASGLLEKSNGYIKQNDRGRALRGLIGAAKYAGRVEAFERINNLHLIAKGRAGTNRKNAVSKINLQIKDFIAERINHLPREHKETFSAAIKYLQTDIENYALEVDPKKSWDDGDMVYKRLNDWRQRDRSFKDKVDKALKSDAQKWYPE